MWFLRREQNLLCRERIIFCGHQSVAGPGKASDGFSLEEVNYEGESIQVGRAVENEAHSV